RSRMICFGGRLLLLFAAVDLLRLAPVGGQANPRFVVTSLSAEEAPQRLYEEIYCARGDMENRIKECQLDLFAGRTMRAVSSTAPAEASMLARRSLAANRCEPQKMYSGNSSSSRSSRERTAPP